MIAPPHPDLRVCVVVPARDEEELIKACLGALAGQEGVEGTAVEVLLVLDACTDATERRALAVAASEPALRLHLLNGPGQGAGAARALGMDVAAERLHAVGRAGGLIACTDADSRVASDWIARQLGAAATGAEAIGGNILLDGASASDLSPATIARRSQGLATRRAALVGPGSATAEHPHFSGASLAITARAYRVVGGMEPLRSLEDEGLAKRLEGAGVPIHRLADVRVTTSARTGGRAGRGLSTDLAVGEWLGTRTWAATDLATDVATDELLAASERSISVILTAGGDPPAQETSLVAGGPSTASERALDRLGSMHDAGLIHELLVAEAGRAEHEAKIGPSLGRGDAMWRAASEARGDTVVFLEADCGDLAAQTVACLVAAIEAEPELRMVKGAFRQDAKVGRSTLAEGIDTLTELVARPLLNLHFPDLVGFADPLSRAVAIDRAVLDQVSMPVGDGVELAMLVDAWRLCGLNGLGQVSFDDGARGGLQCDSAGTAALELLIAVQRRTGPESPGEDDEGDRTVRSGLARPGAGARDPAPSSLVAAASGATWTRPVRSLERPPPGARDRRLPVGIHG